MRADEPAGRLCNDDDVTPSLRLLELLVMTILGPVLWVAIVSASGQSCAATPDGPDDAAQQPWRAHDLEPRGP